MGQLTEAEEATVILFLLTGGLIWGIWKVRDPWRPLEKKTHGQDD